MSENNRPLLQAVLTLLVRKGSLFD